MIYNLDKFLAFKSFRSNVRGEDICVNWFYSHGWKDFLFNSDGYDEYQHQFIEWIGMLEGLVEKNSLTIDIGAFSGDTTLPIAAMAGKDGKCLAFEPHPATYAELDIQVKSNPLLNIDTFNCAAMPYDGEFEFLYQTVNQMKNGGVNAHNIWTTLTGCYPEKVKVIGKNIENLILSYNKRVSFIKVDTEGLDCHVLHTIPNVINKYKPNIIIEWLPTTEDYIRATLSHFNYKAVEIKSKKEIVIIPENRQQDILLIPTP